MVLVARNGRVAYLRAAGLQVRDAGIPMRENTILRIASMTKPISSVAVLMLYEEAACTPLGFFWKAGWAFVVGYFISGAIQAFVPKARLTR